MASSSNDELKAMKYRDLQKIAKEIGVKANLARPIERRLVRSIFF